MFDVKEIQDSLIGIVGFKQPYNPTFAILDSENTTSRSGYYVTDIKLVNIETIKVCQDYKDISDSNFNDLLKSVQRDSIATVCGAVFNQSEYIDRQLIYRYPVNRFETETLESGKFVFHKIEVNKSNIAFEISRLILEFDGTGDVEVLLFNTNQKTALKSQTITIDSDRVEAKLNWVCRNSNNCDWYIGYLTTGLTVTPFKQEENLKNIISDLCISTGSVTHNLDTLFDSRLESYTNDSIGLNLDITVYDDYTDLIIQNERLFAKAVYLDTGIKLLNLCASSYRSNRNDRQASEMYTKIVLEVEGDNRDNHMKIDGYKPQLSRELKQITKELKKLNAGYFGNGYYLDCSL